jgi:uncharacterized protein involved in exopolysaccharide biosynthesis
VALALAVSLSLTTRYTATCRILIEPPAGTVAVSPIYLESLKTYEHFAASDSLFLSALKQFQLRQRFPDRPIESLKAGILKVGMVRDTKILEIKATLPDPRIAQALALYLGEQTVKLSRAVSLEGNQDLTQAIEKEEADARAQLQQSEAAWAQMVTQRPVHQLEEEVQGESILKGSLKRQLLRAEVEASDPQESEAAGARARAETLRKQLAQAEQEMAGKQDLLARRMAERDRLGAEHTARETAYAAVERRLGEVRGDLGYRGEHLKIIDPGIVPERPSSPNIPLNVFAALLLGIVAPVVYLTFELSYQSQRSSARRSALRVTGTGRDARDARDE